MPNVLHALLNASGFIPHGHCYLWQPKLVWLHVVSDSVIALSYFSIPCLLVYFVSKRQDIPFNWIFLMFGGFIIACGTGHIMDIWTLWHPVYWLVGVIKAITAIISLFTALELVSLIPKVLALPSPAQLEAANQELEQTIQKLQQTQSQLIQTEKMSSLGQLVAGVAHEINNPVNFIHGNLTYINEYTQELLKLLRSYQESYKQPTAAVQSALDRSELEFIKEDLPKTIVSMRVGTERIRQIVVTLRNFSRLDESDMKPVNIHEGLDSTLLILQNRLREFVGYSAIQVIKRYGELPLIECYAGQLNQVFMNILSNAIDALEETRVHSSSTDCVPERCPTITIQTQSLDKNRILVEIVDNGIGMSSEVSQKIFNPFFTTKPVGQGTGLGLSISYQIISEKHKGQLRCNSKPGEGTTFSIMIPIQQFDHRLSYQQQSKLVAAETLA